MFDCLKFLAGTLGLLGASVSVCAAAEPAADRHAQMTAAYVYNFIKFVEWPPSALKEDLAVCFVGAPEVRAALAAASANKQATAKRIVARDVPAGRSLEGCQVLFLSGKSAALTAHEAALTIGDSADFTERGGVIRLYTESNRLRFVINVENAKREGIQVSSNLLKLATHVEQGGAR